MFGNAYQNGHYFEVWDSKVNNDKNQAYKQLVKMVPASNKSYFDKEVKSYILEMEGQTNKMILPASDQRQLALHQKYLVLHIYIPIGSPWSMELGITDINGIKRRINFTTAQGKNEVKFFSVRYPLDNLERGTWLFLAFNTYSFIDAFKSQVYRSLDHITICSNCKIRRVFTMKQWQQWEIPKAFWFNSEIPQQFQLIEYRELSLPKIGINKSIMSEQSSPAQYDKLGTIKHSKSNLTRSEIVSKQFQKNSMASQSPPVRPKMESSPKQKTSLISKLNMIKQSKIKQLYKIQSSPKKNQIALTTSKILESKLNTDVMLQKPIKSVIKRSPPSLDKSFQQDQALNYKPDLDSDVNFETSNQSLAHIKQIKNSKKYERWQKQQEIPKVASKIIQKQPQKDNIDQGNSVKIKPNRTILTKQNSKNKIETMEKSEELQLIFDEMVGCYYHPQTHTYYEMKS